MYRTFVFIRTGGSIEIEFITQREVFVGSRCVTIFLSSCSRTCTGTTCVSVHFTSVLCFVQATGGGGNVFAEARWSVPERVVRRLDRHQPHHHSTHHSQSRSRVCLHLRSHVTWRHVVVALQVSVTGSSGSYGDLTINNFLIQSENKGKKCRKVNNSPSIDFAEQKGTFLEVWRKINSLRNPLSFIISWRPPRRKSKEKDSKRPGFPQEK